VIVTTHRLLALLLPVTLRGRRTVPYVGILAFLVLPPFFAGLILIPLGTGSSAARGGGPASIAPESAAHVNNADLRRLVYFVFSLPWSTWRLPARSVTAR